MTKASAFCDITFAVCYSSLQGRVTELEKELRDAPREDQLTRHVFSCRYVVYVLPLC